MSKITTSTSVTDSRMWRRLLARTHPDSGGDHELFVWAQSVRDTVEQGQNGPIVDLLAHMFRNPPSRPAPQKDSRSKKKPWSERRSKQHIPFETELSFGELTARALKMAQEFEEPYGRIFSLLEGCGAPSPDDVPEEIEDAEIGAGYAVLADVGRALGLDGRGRVSIYNHAREIPLTQRHARYLLREVERLAKESPDLAAEIREAAPCRGE